MRRLAFDCSGNDRSVAIAHADALVATRTEHGGRAHAERLVPLIEAVLADGGWTYGDLDELAVGVGPGSFTGIRVAVAAARALGMAVDRPVRTVNSLEGLALGAPASSRPNAGALDARRGAVYLGVVAGAAVTVHPHPIDPARAARLLPPAPFVVGSGAEAIVAAAGGGRSEARTIGADAIARCAIAAARRGVPSCSAHEVRPLYLRAADAVPSAA